MSRGVAKERYPNSITDKVFSRWHRAALPAKAACIDIDMVEYCAPCREPLALIETAEDVGQQIKPVTIMRRIAGRAKMDAYILLMTIDRVAYDRGDFDKAILLFRAQRVCPEPDTGWLSWTPDQCAAFLLALRNPPKHWCRPSAGREQRRTEWRRT